MLTAVLTQTKICASQDDWQHAIRIALFMRYYAKEIFKNGMGKDGGVFERVSMTLVMPIGLRRENSIALGAQ
jgi:hypothetical protein